MAEEYYQSMKRLNYHNDLVLRTPTLTSGERMLMMANRDPLNSFNYILSIAYPKGRKETTNFMDESLIYVKKPTGTFLFFTKWKV